MRVGNHGRSFASLSVRRHLVLACVSAGFFLGCLSCARRISTMPAEVRLPVQAVSVPAREVGGALLVEVMINGRGPYTFIVDTGCSAVVLSEELARDLRELSTDFVVSIEDASGKESRINRLRHIESLRIGGAEFRDLSGLVVGMFGNARDAIGIRVDGLIGFQLFRDCLFTLDFGSRSIRIEHGRLPPPDGKDVFQYRLVGLVPHMPVDVAGKNILTLIDSGNTGAFDLPDIFDESAYETGPVSGPGVVTASGVHRERLVRLKGSARIGRHLVDKPVVSLRKVPVGLVGVEVLKNFRITFDTKAGRVRFDRTSRDPIVIEPVRTTGAGFRKREHAWLVGDVVPGSPAAKAGIVLGDSLVAIDGIPVAELDYNSFKELERTRDSLVLEFEREGQRIQLTVDVVELVP